MTYESKNFEHILGTPGFSEQLLKNHFALYQGYVANTNKLLAELKALTAGEKTNTPVYAELKRRFGWEFNGMRLHELYFENMTKNSAALAAETSLYKNITENFGSYDNWQKDFQATGAMRGIGWAILTYDTNSARLFNIWVDEHNLGHLSDSKPLLIMDVFEHAFMLDYGLRRADYIQAFISTIDWSAVQKRLQ